MSQGLPIVALVCSAGGLPALEQILAGLAADVPAAFIVLRHQDPRSGDHLARILQRHTRLPVAAARDGHPLRPGQVVVAPAGHHTLVTRERSVALVASGERPPYRPSADLLLTSMAVAAGADAVAVVLSGYGNDGATGATAIHHFGGMVIAADEATAAVFAMPYAAISRDDIVDHVLPVGEIAQCLTAHLAGLALPAPAGAPTEGAHP